MWDHTHTDERPEREKVTDPVCGMSFAVEKAATRTEFGGKTYYFCANACLRQFEEDPARYIHAAGAESS